MRLRRDENDAGRVVGPGVVAVHRVWDHAVAQEAVEDDELREEVHCEHQLEPVLVLSRGYWNDTRVEDCGIEGNLPIAKLVTERTDGIEVAEIDLQVAS